MSVNPTQLQGSAIFGTANGLILEGDGILAGAEKTVSIFEFDIERKREGLLRQLESDKLAYLFRRIVNKSSSTIDLFNKISHCLDSYRRHGFFGASLAFYPDQTRPLFNNWQENITRLDERFKTVMGFFETESKELYWHPLDPNKYYKPSEWFVAKGGTKYFHSIDWSSKETVIETLQAMAFSYGSSYTTMLIFDTNMDSYISKKTHSIK